MTVSWRKILIFPDWTYKILRRIIVSLLVGLVLLYAVLYLMLTIPYFQNQIKEIGEEELSKLMHSEVKIGRAQIYPFNKVILRDITLKGEQNDTIAQIETLGAGVSVYKCLTKGKIVFTFAEIIGLDAHINKATPDGKLNIQGIIDAFSPKNKNKPPTKFDLAFYSVLIRKSNIHYDVLSLPSKADRFDVNHIAIKDFTADIFLPQIKNDDFKISVKRLALSERSGFKLKRLSFNADIDNAHLALKDVIIELNHSMITPNDIELKYSSLKNIAKEIKENTISIGVGNSYITPADFACFAPILNDFNQKFNLSLAVNGRLDNLNISVLNIEDSEKQFHLDMNGKITGLPQIDKLKFNIPYLNVKASKSFNTSVLSKLNNVPQKASTIVSNLGDISLNYSISGTKDEITSNGDLQTTAGDIVVNATYSQNGSCKHIVGDISSEDVAVSAIWTNDYVDNIGFNLSTDLLINSGRINGEISGMIPHTTVKGYTYNDIDLSLSIKDKSFGASININDPNLIVSLKGNALINGYKSSIQMNMDVAKCDLEVLNLSNKTIKNCSFVLNADISSLEPNNIIGMVNLSDVTLKNNDNFTVHLDDLQVSAYHDTTEGKDEHIIALQSDFINGQLYGRYNFKELIPTLKDIVANALPDLVAHPSAIYQSDSNSFEYNFTIIPKDDVFNFFRLSKRPLDNVIIAGCVKEDRSNLMLSVPYIQNGKKLIEGTSLNVDYDKSNNFLSISAQTKMPSKQGPILLNTLIDIADNQIDSKLMFDIQNKKKFNGELSLSSRLKLADKKLLADIDVNPSNLVINDSTWIIHPAKINIEGKRLTVDGFELSCNEQYLKIGGVASELPEDELLVQLNSVSLDFVFDALNIPNVTFGGTATGKFYASNLFDFKNVRLSTPNLHVIDLAYNNCIFGDADITSKFDTQTQGINIYADILKKKGKHQTIVDGSIFPTRDSLYLDFKCNKVNVEFLKPYMSAFCSDIKGLASGHGVLFGNFKTINFKGDVFAENLQMKIDYLNTYYTCTDSVHIKPNYISLDGITLYDKFGHTAKLGGYVKHKAFHDAEFNIQVTDAKDFLCYDITREMNSKWYGTIYGIGRADIVGRPGIVDISVNMQTAPKSVFNFVLEKQETANNYQFITIKDRNPKVDKEEIDTIPEKVKKFRRAVVKEESNPTDVHIDIDLEATPQAQMVLVMDPVTDDRIRAYGKGNINMRYNSNNDELYLNGTYALEKGVYNFTLQDIVIKDFTIMNGSKITFTGNPMEAQLDISAAYSLTANLTDLDESFSSDKDMKRTNVPVKAIVEVTGDLNNPQLSFDLDFPTLTSEGKRKVFSIVNTDELVQQEVIYLVGLNRFYTPQYMGLSNNTTSEFASLATSTISSQLGSMLGKISDNLSIAPNLRTSKGDFTDLEVDVALSSSLFNNRLLLNGNFGYRDNRLNSSSSNFIGDFDLEYLLTRNGGIRLKAYNHFNDQNNYVKNSLTTQGVGLEFKYTFDRFFEFLKRKKKVQLIVPSSDAQEKK